MTSSSFLPVSITPHVAWRPRPAAGAPALLSADAARRVLNIVVAFLGILLTAPLMLAIALIVKGTSSGPVLYRQTRIGIDRRARKAGGADPRRQCDLGGQPFMMYKFRTMYVQTAQPHVWALPGDRRITPVGRVLRAFRLDELPQLFNVLRGDMNVVGPRPEQPDIFARLRGELHGYTWRQWVHPGITGWAQIHLGYDQTLDDARRKLEYDLDYIRRRSPMADLRIMLRTVPVMLGRRGSL